MGKESANDIVVSNYYDKQIENPARLLFDSLKDKMQLAEKTIERVYQKATEYSPVIAQIKEATKKGYRFVVDMSDEVKADIDAGRIKLSVENNGKVYAQVRKANGQYGTKFPIKKEDFAKGIDPVQMANAIQMMALEDKLNSIEGQIMQIDRGVQDVLQGQQSDRIGLYYSGFALYLEAQSTRDKGLRNMLISQSLRSLSDASFQLGLKMQADIDYLSSGEYKKEKGKSVKLIDSHMESINQSFGFIHQAFLLRAGIYCKEGELASMNTVLNEYAKFINQTIENNAVLLSQCDKNDDGTDRGIWNSRKNLRIDSIGLLNKPDGGCSVMYLDIVKETDHES